MAGLLHSARNPCIRRVNFYAGQFGADAAFPILGSAAHAKFLIAPPNR